MRSAWAVLYVLGSIWIVGMLISFTGVPFNPVRLTAPLGPVAVAAPGLASSAPPVPAPAAPPAAAPNVSGPVSGVSASGPASSAPAAAAQPAAAPAPSTSATTEQHVSHATVATTETRGAQLLQPRLEGGVKVFDLEAKVVQWEVIPGTFVEAWTYNGQVPGPLLRVSEGDRVRVNLKNSLPEPTVIHFHGNTVPNGQDGVPDVTQPVVQPGQSFTYEFTAAPAGTFIYHTHHNSAVQEPKGLYGMLIIDPKAPAATYDREYIQVVSELGGYFVINGKAFPATEPLTAHPGERVLIRLANLGQSPHPMHMHGHPFRIVGTDGHPVEGPALIKDTVNIAPGERYDLEVTAENPGTWLFHCHILSHVQNQGKEPGGMISLFKVE